MEPRTCAGIALVITVWAFFVAGATAGIWPWVPDFWPFFYSAISGFLIVPKRLMAAYLLATALLAGISGIWFYFLFADGNGRVSLLVGMELAALALFMAFINARKGSGPRSHGSD